MFQPAIRISCHMVAYQWLLSIRLANKLYEIFDLRF